MREHGLTLHAIACMMASKPPSGASRLPEIWLRSTSTCQRTPVTPLCHCKPTSQRQLTTTLRPRWSHLTYFSWPACNLPAISQHLRKIYIFHRFLTSGDLDLWPFVLNRGIPVIHILGNVRTIFLLSVPSRFWVKSLYRTNG